jgi:hypothetical protein
VGIAYRHSLFPPRDNGLMAKEKDNPVTHIGITNFRDDRRVFGIKKKDRRQHMYLIGQTGTGKTTMLESMIEDDMRNGEGIAVLDPHGDFIEHILESVPEHRKKDLIYFNVPDPNCPYGFNPFERVPAGRRTLAASGILESFEKIWSTTWGPRLEHILRNTLLTLLEQPRATLGDIPRLFGEETFRREAVSRLTNPQVKKFWTDEFERYPYRYRQESLSPIQNKVGAFLATPVIYRVMVENKNTLDLRNIIDEGKILLVNLAKGKIGGDNSSLLGALLVSQLELAALSRADRREVDRKDFYLYLDEFQNFTTMSLVSMLSELRKYHLNIIMAHQYLSQVEPEVREAIFGNVGTIISFRIGTTDARIIEKVFYPEFKDTDLLYLPNFSIILRLMIDGKLSRPFTADTLPPHENLAILAIASLGIPRIVELLVGFDVRTFKRGKAPKNLPLASLRLPPSDSFPDFH